MTTALLEVRGLVKHYRLRGGWPWSPARWLRAVDGVSFELAAGETLGLVGESGCGKSTLGRALLRLVEPTAGEVRLNGESLTALDGRALTAQRKHVQMIFQDPYASLPPRRTVEQILREPLDWHRIGTPASRAGRVGELLARVGLGPSALPRYPHAFSGGQRQRIGIARALAVEPQLIIADEAVSALDVSVQSQILNLLADLQQELGLAYLFIAHDLAVVQHISDRVAVMYLGEIVEQASSRRLYAQPAHPYTRALIDAVPRPASGHRGHRAPLVGEVPSPVEPPSGCRFHTRCPHARPICRSMAPREIELGTAGESHRVRCHLHDPEIDEHFDD
ncbi:ATP-binding cassette domain-containing protein [Wenzhouxiangella sp. XN79A]|uniref:ABC transporter ATP-binding protein n=1 Tax=Wenzhouxiangella sp. XN79A TaxID=2724193 RepID=UPI00144A676D|nr:oligopeptide/dipeptide ABC transporter ATP-binding protein [Wenzhouxiangella sp. XN79A]NKI34926.1 ATP-binding cassette domain-containing protein [Wenzhouxiangella sp. XN79A]